MLTTQTQDPVVKNRDSSYESGISPAHKPFLRQSRVGKPFVWTIVTVLATVVVTCIAVECLARVLMYFGPVSDMRDNQTGAKMQVAKSVATCTDPVIIFTGDSVGTTGIYADYIERKLRHLLPKVRVVNLATSGSCFEEKSVLIRTAIGSHAGPRLVVFQLSSNALEKELGESSDPLHRFKQSFVGRYKLEEPKNFSEVCQRFAHENSYLIRYQQNWHALVSNILPVLLETERRIWRGSVTIVAKECSPGGWTPMFQYPAINENFDQYTQLGWQNYYKTYGRLMTSKWLWDFSRVNKMQDFCHENNLPLMFLWMPELTSHTSQYNVKNFSVEQCVDAVSAKVGNEAGRFIDLHDADKDEMHFRNWDHFTVPGVLFVADLIVERLANSPFVKQHLN
jgi:hypothetical protein